MPQTRHSTRARRERESEAASLFRAAVEAGIIQPTRQDPPPQIPEKRTLLLGWAERLAAFITRSVFLTIKWFIVAALYIGASALLHLIIVNILVRLPLFMMDFSSPLTTWFLGLSAMFVWTQIYGKQSLFRWSLLILYLVSHTLAYNQAWVAILRAKGKARAKNASM